MQKIGIITGALFMLTAVMLGAFGAHGLKEMISTENITVFKTGVFYQFVHAISILIAAIMIKVYKVEKLKYSICFFSLGIIFFSGSLYLLSTSVATGLNVKMLGPITPIGGLFFIVGWLVMIIAMLKN